MKIRGFEMTFNAATERRRVKNRTQNKKKLFLDDVRRRNESEYRRIKSTVEKKLFADDKSVMRSPIFRTKKMASPIDMRRVDLVPSLEKMVELSAKVKWLSVDISSSEDKKLVCMGGIGKRTLPSFIYSHHGIYKNSPILCHIDIGERVTRSLEYKQILLQLLSSQGKPTNEIKEETEEVYSVKEKVGKLEEEKGFQDLQPTSSTVPLIITDEKRKMVGCDDELVQLMDMLTGQQSKRQVIPINGMGGIGKTMLARKVYEDLLIVERFHIRLWVTVSQEYNLREILLELLSAQIKSNSGIDQETDSHLLGEKLYKSLCGRRYLIVLDDMWSIEAWDAIRLFFPDNNNESRIVVTTRESNLATHFGSTCLLKKFLDEDASWNLFRQEACGGEGCPPYFEAIGKKIARKCNGLPLSIAVIGGLLRKSTRTLEYWESIAKDINSILNSGENEQCLNILSLSYRRLPSHLKPCFLYMAMFPEDCEIRVSPLIKTWVVEGFLKPNKAQSLEEVAECCLKDLVDRNLILIRKLGSTGKIKTCFIHDVVRDLCLRVAEKEKFLCVMRLHDIPRGINLARRILCRERNENRVFHTSRAASLARSLACHADVPLSAEFELLRPLNLFLFYNGSPEAHFRQVNLQYLENSSHYVRTVTNHTLSSKFSLWNEQALFIKVSSPIVAPSEIWEKTQLRHLIFENIYLPDPLEQPHGCFILQNLQTLQTVVNLRLTSEVCKRIPNLKKLKIRYGEDFSASYCLFNLRHFHKLKSLSLAFSFDSLPRRGDLLQNLMFPDSLEKLSLFNSNLHWKDLTMIGSLPHLEVLKLGLDSVRGREWTPVEGEFLKLKYLKIDYCNSDLIRWNAYTSHFQVLENLVLHGLQQLDEIPLDMGEIPTLRFISLCECSESAAMSAMRILEEHENLGNEDLQVRLTFRDEEGLESFKEKMEQELDNFTSTNLQLEISLNP